MFFKLISLPGNFIVIAPHLIVIWSAFPAAIINCILHPCIKSVVSIIVPSIRHRLFLS